MKNSIYLLGLTLVLFFTGCKTSNLSIKIYTPPLVQLPTHIKQIALANRTIIDSAKKEKNLIEAIITGESFLGDKVGAEDCIFSFSKYMNYWGPVKAIVPDKHKLYGNIGGFNTDPLNWNTVTKICRESNSNALMCLEKFDTNSDATVGAVNTGVNVINNVLNGGTLNTGGAKDIHYVVDYGWILYDTLSRTIIYYRNDVINEIARGVPLFAPLPTQAVENTARYIGEREASRFNSTFYWAHREYYRKAKNSKFRVGYRRAVVNDWDGAIEIWMKNAKSSKRKTAGRACYNLAIAYEVKGDLNEALKWAQKAYSDYGTRLARDYVPELQYRLRRGY